jgi:hypothetical protein
MALKACSVIGIRKSTDHVESADRTSFANAPGLVSDAATRRSALA